MGQEIVGGSHGRVDGRFTIFPAVPANTALSNFGDSNSLRANAGFRTQS